jgi:NAD(P)H dehydrogenase (quinone)
MKITLLYTEVCGFSREMADCVVAGLADFFDETPYYLEIKLMNTEYHQEVDTQFLAESQAILLGTPVVDSYVSKQIHKFIIYEKDLDLRGKLGAFATTDGMQQNAEVAAERLIMEMIMRGMLVCTGGATDGRHVDESAYNSYIGNQMRLFGKRIAGTICELYSKDM